MKYHIIYKLKPLLISILYILSLLTAFYFNKKTFNWEISNYTLVILISLVIITAFYYISNKKNKNSFVYTFYNCSDILVFNTLAFNTSWLFLLFNIIIVLIYSFLVYKQNIKRLTLSFYTDVIPLFLFIQYFSLIPYIYNNTATYTTIFTTITSLLVFVIPILIFPRFQKYLLTLFLIIGALYSFPALFHKYMYGDAINQSAYYSMFESPSDEVFSFFSMYFTWDIFLLFISFLIVPIVFIRYFTISKEHLPKTHILLLLLIFLSCSIPNISYNTISDYLYYKNKYNREIELFEAKMKEQKNMNLFSDISVDIPKNKQITYYIIIGESTARQHMGLYGYARNTNPRLTNKKDSLYIFTNTISPHSHTIASLSKILTFSNNKDESLLYSKGNLIQIFNAAGFATYWISNQSLSAEPNSIVNTIAQNALNCTFLSEDKKIKTKRYDGYLLPEIAKVSENHLQKKCVFIHLLGTHGDYKDRYPIKYETWKSNDSLQMNITEYKNSDFAKYITNMYDNAVLYNDYIISEIINIAQKSNDYSYVLYISDHGEDVYDSQSTFSHQEANATTYMFEIPFIIWCSESYKKYNTKTNLFNNYVHLPYQTDNIIHTILDISKIRVPEYDSTLSIVSGNYKPYTRIIANKDYDSLKALKLTK